MSCRDLPRQVMLGRKLPTRTGDFSELVDSNLPVIFLENLRFFLVSGRDLQMSDSWKDFIGCRFFYLSAMICYVGNAVCAKHFGNCRRVLA